MHEAGRWAATPTVDADGDELDTYNTRVAGERERDMRVREK